MSWCCCCCLRRGVGRIGALERRIFLLVLGLDGAGKTCVAKAIVDGNAKDLGDIAPTVGFSKMETRYKGFQVCMYDLGGSSGFRGIWPKYYHEVHGFIFVVDASDTSRMSENREAFRSLLRSDKVRGKPLLLLCNKSDGDDALDEIAVVDELDVERMVNDARCPTRVEKSVATKYQGLRVGYKWLVKSIIANMVDLGPRVEADINLEQKLEENRRQEIKRKIEERNRLEMKEMQDNGGEDADRGFVPISELKAQIERDKAKNSKNNSEIILNPRRVASISNGAANKEASSSTSSLVGHSRRASEATANTAGEESLAAKVAISRGGSTADVRVGNGTSNGHAVAEQKKEHKEETKAIVNGHAKEVEMEEEEEDAGEVIHAVNGNNHNGLPPLTNGANDQPRPPVTENHWTAEPQLQQQQTTHLDLEPISRPKKQRNLLRKLNKTAPGVASSVYGGRSKSGSVDSGSSYRHSSNGSARSSVESVRDSQVIKAYT